MSVAVVCDSLYDDAGEVLESCGCPGLKREELILACQPIPDGGAPDVELPRGNSPLMNYDVRPAAVPAAHR